ncbi:MAG: hypothetical protein CMJ49_02650 [Planctomycetaceae bacterium]|nr:hypothetical protein [Planctomycetaceae bacterium]
MTVEAIFGLQFVLSVVVIGLLVKWQVAPWLAKQTWCRALFWLTVPHAFRHVGMVFLVDGVVARPLKESFATYAAYGDLAAGVLALASLIALRTGWRGAIVVVWVFNVVGTVDLLNALRHWGVVPDMGAAWYIPTFVVPLLLVTHFMIFARLIRRSA